MADDSASTSAQLAELIHQVARQPVSSPDFRISQHVDYFPLRGGLAPVLPMSASIDWTGRDQAPAMLSFVESIENLDLSAIIVNRNIRSHWDGHKLSWEHDDQLRPGHYIWRVILHDNAGQVLASAQQTVAVHFPREVTLRQSSLVLGSSCGNPGEMTSGLKKRPPPGSAEPAKPYLSIDPLRIADCRVQPASSGVFTSTDQLHALLRIYPEEQYKKHRPESWTAKFVLRSQNGAIEEEREVQFLVDSGSGYLASVEIPLGGTQIGRGSHTVEVETCGPGIRGDLKQSRIVQIQ